MRKSMKEKKENHEQIGFVDGANDEKLNTW